ncbi:hypothetical protein BJ912DRAFT_1042928 [Pholiota molesta]|nr:hypothetical protein BJ912DRAFT_1042928 [Pholiota molesta]
MVYNLAGNIARAISPGAVAPRRARQIGEWTEECTDRTAQDGSGGVARREIAGGEKHESGWFVPLFDRARRDLACTEAETRLDASKMLGTAATRSTAGRAFDLIATQRKRNYTGAWWEKARHAGNADDGARRRGLNWDKLAKVSGLSAGRAGCKRGLAGVSVAREEAGGAEDAVPKRQLASSIRQ